MAKKLIPALCALAMSRAAVCGLDEFTSDEGGVCEGTKWARSAPVAMFCGFHR